jgi:hypothetical protein
MSLGFFVFREIGVDIASFFGGLLFLDHVGEEFFG